MAKEHKATFEQVLNSSNDHQGMMSMAGHHSLPPVIMSFEKLSFSSILMIMPLLVGASATMIILWL